MKPLQALRLTVQILEQLDCNFCLIGGHAASLYRSQERFTRDVDFAISTNNPMNARAIAEDCIQRLGFESMCGIIPQGASETGHEAISLVCSAPQNNELKGIIDILLPVLPWVVDAVKRAQHNKLDLGFAMVPVITPEDLIVSKCYSYKNCPDRFQDLDDIKNILENNDLDRDYLMPKLEQLSLNIPELVISTQNKKRK